MGIAEPFGGTPLDLAPGSTLGRYELLAPIAAGGMARVWAARLRGHAGFSKLVAVKMILPHLSEDGTFQEMFMDEARLASNVRHPNVCETYDLDQTKGVLYLAMEWVDGTSLLRVLRAGAAGGSAVSGPGSPPRVPLSPRLAARIIADACAGLHAAHELRADDGSALHVVHRDATPHNILIGADGRVKVSDFGVAKARGQSHSTVTGQVKGKVSYMAPEQLTGEAIDRRVDIFALGACLYECVTGLKAFTGETDAQVMSKILIGKYERPSVIARGIPPMLEQIIVRAMQVAPANRFPTAEAMQQALEDFISKSGPPVLASAVGAMVRERCAEEITQRREKIKAASARPEVPASMPDLDMHVTVSIDATDTERIGSAPRAPVSSQVDAGSGSHSGSLQMNGAMELSKMPARSPPWGIFAAAAAVVALVVAGAGVVAFVKLRSGSSLATRSMNDAPSATLALAAPIATAPSPHRAVEANAPGVQAAVAPRDNVIRFAVTPSNTLLVVDGVALPSGTTSIQRRTDGITQTVLLRADKYEDYVVLVDDETPSDLEVSLSPVGAAQKPRVMPRRVVAVASASASAAPAADPPASTALPNPYGQ